jgi:DNA-binding PadR family transcriptional regulator
MAHPERLGEFEHAVLVAIVHLEDDAYGVTIRREIESRTGRSVTVGALYTGLDRLERKGYVTSAMSAPTAERGGRSKRHFQISRAGGNALRASREFLTQMWAGLALDAKRSRP